MKVEPIYQMCSVSNDNGEHVGLYKRYSPGLWFKGELPVAGKDFAAQLELAYLRQISRESGGR